MKATELGHSQLAAAIGMRELNDDELRAVSGGDKARDDAAVEALLWLQQAELDEIEVEPVPYVSLHLPE